jgi:tetratricopeptide (TPR) repeat protein
MKVLREIVVLILIVLFLTSLVAYAQSPAKESYDKGVEYAIQGEFEKAKEEFEKALEADKSLRSAKNSLKTIMDVIEQKIKRETTIYLFEAVSFDNKGQHDQAIKDSNKALEINPMLADAYINRGNAYYEKGQFDQAIKDYSKAIEIDLGYALAYKNRGFTYLVKLGDKVKGCADLKRACELGECANYNWARQKGYCR